MDLFTYELRTLLLQNRYASFLNFDHPLIRAEHLRPETCSFDVGVFVTDLDLWRHYNITQKMEFWIKANSQYVWFYSHVVLY